MIVSVGSFRRPASSERVGTAPTAPTSQATSTTDGSSDTAEKLAQDLVELVRTLEVDEMARTRDLAHVVVRELLRGDERVELADDEFQGPGERADDVRRVLAV